MTRIAVVAGTRTKTRSAVIIGVPVDPMTLSGLARFLLWILKMNDVDDAGRNLGALRRTMHLVPTRTRGTTSAHTATAVAADAGTDRALLRRRRLVRRRCPVP